MRLQSGLFWVAIGALLIPSGTVAQEPFRWQPTLESAKRLAAQTDRLVLIHFWADYCRACRQMEQEVLRRPDVASRLQSSYVPVKINAAHFPATARQFRVNALPTTVIITPQGQPLDSFQGRVEPSKYLARLNQVAAATRQQPAGTYTQIPGGPAPAIAGGADPPRDRIAYRSQDIPGPLDDRTDQPAVGRDWGVRATPADPWRERPTYANPSVPQPGILNSPPVTAPPRMQPPPPTTAETSVPPPQPGPNPQPSPAQPGSDNPPLGMDGYCPVQLCDDMNSNKLRWTLGDRRWGAVHQGRTYLFAGPEQRRRFLTDPGRYAPVISGDDAVTAVDRGQTVPGRREHGVLFDNRIYLFADEANLERFQKNPDYYARQVLQTTRASADQRRQIR